MIKLQDLGGCHNINFVTPEHVVPQVAMAIIEARDMGLRIPIVYNTGGYDALEAIELMEGLVDIYLVDFKVLFYSHKTDVGMGRRDRCETLKGSGLSATCPRRDQGNAQTSRSFSFLRRRSRQTRGARPTSSHAKLTTRRSTDNEIYC